MFAQEIQGQGQTLTCFSFTCLRIATAPDKREAGVHCDRSAWFSVWEDFGGKNNKGKEKNGSKILQREADSTGCT